MSLAPLIAGNPPGMDSPDPLDDNGLSESLDKPAWANWHTAGRILGPHPMESDAVLLKERPAGADTFQRVQVQLNQGGDRLANRHRAFVSSGIAFSGYHRVA